MKRNSKLSFFLALAAGAILPLAFAPFGYSLIVFFSVGLLLLSLLKTTPRQALSCGWLWGLSSFGLVVYWVFISIHNFGNATTFLAAFITTLFILILAAFPATLTWTWAYFTQRQNQVTKILAFPAFWVLWEYLRTWA